MKKHEKNEAVEDAMATLQKKYGKDVVIQMDADMDFKVERITTGCLSLDNALGGGLPIGRLIEVFGKESSGKSTLTTFLMAQVQKAGGRAALIDAEMAFDGAYAKAIGRDIMKKRWCELNDFIYLELKYNEYGRWEDLIRRRTS